MQGKSSPAEVRGSAPEVYFSMCKYTSGADAFEKAKNLTVKEVQISTRQLSVVKSEFDIESRLF